MTGHWTKWRISSAIDGERPLPPSLLRKIDRDPECRRFYEASLAMADRLRRDAAEIVRHEQDRLGDAVSLPVPAAGAPLPRSVLRSARRFALALAAVILATVVGVWIWRWPPSARPPGPESPRLAKQRDLRELMQIARQLEKTVDRVAAREGPRLRAQVARSGEALRKPILREVSNMEADTWGILRRLFSVRPSEGDSPDPESEADPPPPSSSGRRFPRSPEEALLAGSRMPAEAPL